MVREPDATRQPAPQDNQLMSKHRVLSFKPQLRPEWRGQHGQNETEQPDHSASLGDSITSITSDKVFGTHRHGRRQILWFGVTAHPTADWIANQLTEACEWELAPRYLIRDRDRAYGGAFSQRL